MTPNSAKTPSRRIAILVYPGVTLLDVTGPLQVFSSANDLSRDGQLYETILLSAVGGTVISDTGLPLPSQPMSAVAPEQLDTFLVAGGTGVFDALEDPQLVARTAHMGRRARRAGSTCMGALLTAAAGLNAGRRVVTHWRWCDELARRNPDVRVESDPIFINDGGIWSSAGVSAGIDLALAMVEEDHGRRLSLAIARSLVVHLKRPGGQSQFSAALQAQMASADSRLQALVDWITGHLDADLSVARLAERVHMSPRNFARRFSEAVGEPPARAVERLRVDYARQLLETTNLALSEVAARSGLRSHDRMRAGFIRHLGVSPAGYRRGFGPAGGPDARAPIGR